MEQASEPTQKPSLPNADLIRNPAHDLLSSYHEQLKQITDDYLKNPGSNSEQATLLKTQLEKKFHLGLNILHPFIRSILMGCSTSWGSVDTRERFYSELNRVYTNVDSQIYSIIDNSNSMIRSLKDENQRLLLENQRLQGEITKSLQQVSSSSNALVSVQSQTMMIEVMKQALQSLLPQLTQNTENHQASAPRSRATVFKKPDANNGHNAQELGLKEGIFTQAQLEFLKALSTRLSDAVSDQDKALTGNICKAAIILLTNEDKTFAEALGKVDLDDIVVPDEIKKSRSIDPEACVRYARLIVQDVYRNQYFADFLGKAYAKLTKKKVEEVVDDSKNTL